MKPHGGTPTLRFDPEEGWSAGDPGDEAAPASMPWPVQIAGLTMELRATASGGVGLYPEHVANLPWLEEQVVGRLRAGGEEPVSVLNLFAHTGLLTLAAARAGATVAHVDAARSAIAWARRNAELSGLADRPVRWLVDDAASFVAREARRGRRYDGIVLDPPSFGHAGKAPLAPRGRAARPPGGMRGDPRGRRLRAADRPHRRPRRAEPRGHGPRGVPFRRARITSAPLDLVAASGARLELGWSVRIDAR